MSDERKKPASSQSSNDSADKSERAAGDADAQPSTDQSAGNSATGPGGMLSAARQARELTIDEVGDALNLAPQTVQWLESDAFAELPAPAFTQGYIRNYAKFVELDADAVVAAYQEKAGKPDVAWESPRGTAGLTELVQRHPGLLISVVVASVVLLIIVILAVVWPDEDTTTGSGEASVVESSGAVSEETTVAVPSSDTSRDTSSARRADAPSGNSSLTTAPSTTTDTARRFDDPAANGIDRDAIDPNDPLAHLPVAKTFPVDATRPASTGTPEQAQTAAPAVDSASANDGDYRLNVSRRLTPAGDDQVRLEVVEDCWIALRNVAGDDLYSILGRPGQTITLTGQGPFRVLLGYAPGAQLYLNDRQILLEPYTRNNVASLVIGQ